MAPGSWIPVNLMAARAGSPRNNATSNTTSKLTERAIARTFRLMRSGVACNARSVSVISFRDENSLASRRRRHSAASSGSGSADGDSPMFAAS